MSKIQILEKTYLECKKKISKIQQAGQKIQTDQIQNICRIMNLISMQRLRQNQFTQAQQWLIRSLRYAQNHPLLTASIQNNIACLYKQQNHFGQAILHLQKAQCIIKQSKQQSKQQYIELLGDCYLNMGSVLSAMNQHSLALKNIRKCLKLIKQINEDNKQQLKVYSIAKFNQAVQLEHLRRFEQSIQSYEEVKALIEHQVIQNNLIQFVNSALDSLKSKLVIKPKPRVSSFRIANHKTSSTSSNSYNSVLPSSLKPNFIKDYHSQNTNLPINIMGLVQHNSIPKENTRPSKQINFKAHNSLRKENTKPSKQINLKPHNSLRKENTRPSKQMNSVKILNSGDLNQQTISKKTNRNFSIKIKRESIENIEQLS